MHVLFCQPVVLLSYLIDAHAILQDLGSAEPRPPPERQGYDVPSSYGAPNRVFFVKYAMHSPVLLYCLSSPVQCVIAVLQMLCASPPVIFWITDAVLLAPSFGLAASKSVSTAHSHHTKVASYCEICLSELKVFHVSMRTGRTRFRAVKLNMNLFCTDRVNPNIVQNYIAILTSLLGFLPRRSGSNVLVCGEVQYLVLDGDSKQGKRRR